ncbi:patatin-like phospholipase family protein [Bosea psychrotolerans]|uniref:Patatin-like phospholipase n=1 Tax=Bosea psychrotolerans TaxID=1871628 RepID=A0A2S4LSX6_9HYPH|nr:patatin-like phospholipase family protein [Bosea psychrotolerans]POR45566.1 patatin-like phospholipase [Bosea psychrotolerans]
MIALQMSRAWPLTRSALGLAFLALAGCASAPRTPFTLQEQAIAQVPGFPDVRVWGDGSLADFARQRLGPSPRKTSSLTYLALSGGGSGGAFGAGVLAGWTASGKRPRFDLVSGVSTGALIAPFAFLGPGYDETLIHIYTSGITSKLYQMKWLPSGLLGSGLLEAGPLRRMVEQYATRELLTAVAAEHRKGRRLIVVTTNMDAQRPVVWDMGRIASSGQPGALKLFQDVLVASASIPAAFPPVLLDVQAGSGSFQELHSDGATANQVFTIPDSVLLSPRPGRLPGLGKADLYVIINNALIPEFDVVSNSTFSVGSRALSTMIKAQTRSAINATYGFSKRAGIRFHLAAIDKAVPYNPTDAFNQDYMQTIFKLGYEESLSGKLWKSTPPFGGS